MLTRRQLLGSITVLGTNVFIPFPSVALQEGEPSRTAQGAALLRAAHQLLETPLVFDDPLALRILGPQRRRLLESDLDRYREPGSRALRAFIVVRSRFAEDELARSVSQGTRQYLVLGAGLDTFAYRNPHGESLRVFEVDHPTTQDWKRRRLQDQGIDVPRSLSFVAVDFEKDSLADRLRSSGFRRDTPVFISWLGVTVYLTREAVMQTLGFVARECAPGSRIVFDFAVPDGLLGEAERNRRDELSGRVAKLGEPWISYFDPQALAGDLLAVGFTGAVSLAASALNERYFVGRADGFRVHGSSGRIMSAYT